MTMLTMLRWDTYLHKLLESGVSSHLVVNSVGCDGVIGDILHICLAEVQDGIVNRGSNTADAGVFIALDLMERVEHFAVMHVKFSEIVEDVVDKLR